MDDIGSITVERNWDATTASHSLRITHADPRVRVSRELIDDARNGATFAGHFRLVGDVLTIADDYGQRFIYRIRDDGHHTYLAEWPD